ncbi:hypothetical protein AB0J40_36720 [Amycolatopsis sp. NPDC049691]|uniref:hypothetical protein n=1 Tax=Amycolatopsis sp. NPDC049691 TaxID=3155155 RepID=UPI00341E2BD0
MPARLDVPPNGPERKKFDDLVRSERLLRKKLAERRARIFDQDTADDLREKLDTLLNSMSAIALDEPFWERLKNTEDYAPLTEEDLDELTQVAWATLPYVLETWGYADPPPPPASVLVANTVTALNAAFDFATDRHTAINETRWHLTTLVMRVRRQIGQLTTSGSSPERLHGLAKSLGTSARDLIVPVGASFAGIITESLAAKSDPTAAKLAGKFAEHSTRLGLEAVVGRSAERRASTAQPSDRALREITPIAVHLNGVSDNLHRASVEGAEDQVGGLLAYARKHASRVRELAGGRTPHLSHAVDNLAATLIQAIEIHRSGGDPTELLDASQDALGIAYRIVLDRADSLPRTDTIDEAEGIVFPPEVDPDPVSFHDDIDLSSIDESTTLETKIDGDLFGPDLSEPDDSAEIGSGEVNL